MADIVGFRPLYFAPPGELLVEGDRVCCHLCGGWYLSVASHLRVHGWSKAAYIEAFGLELTNSLTGPATRKRRSAAMTARQAVEPALLRSQSRARARARSGALTAAAGAAARGRAHPPERRAKTLRTLAAIDPAARAEGARRRADERLAQVATGVAARSGFADFDAYLRDRLASGTSLAAISRAAGVHKDWLSRHLSRLAPDLFAPQFVSTPAGLGQVGLGQAGLGQAGLGQAAPAQVGPVQADSAQLAFGRPAGVRAAGLQTVPAPTAAVPTAAVPTAVGKAASAQAVPANVAAVRVASGRADPAGADPAGAASGRAVPMEAAPRSAASARILGGDVRERLRRAGLAPHPGDVRLLPAAVRGGFAEVGSYLRARHAEEHRSVASIAAEAGVSRSVIGAALVRHGLPVVPHAAKRHQAAGRAREVAQALGYDSLAAYVTDRRAHGATWSALATESGVPQSTLRRHRP